MFQSVPQSLYLTQHLPGSLSQLLPIIRQTLLALLTHILKVIHQRLLMQVRLVRVGLLVQVSNTLSLLLMSSSHLFDKFVKMRNHLNVSFKVILMSLHQLDQSFGLFPLSTLCMFL